MNADVWLYVAIAMGVLSLILAAFYGRQVLAVSHLVAAHVVRLFRGRWRFIRHYRDWYSLWGTCEFCESGTDSILHSFRSGGRATSVHHDGERESLLVLGTNNAAQCGDSFDGSSFCS